MYHLTLSGKGYLHANLYKGRLEKGTTRDGFGFQLFPNGCYYIGYWKDNMAEGSGCLTLCDGTTYEGRFARNCLLSGYIRYFNSGRFEGTFSGDKFERFQKGSFYFSNGHVLTGEWKEGVLESGRLKLNTGETVVYNPKEGLVKESNGRGVIIPKDEKWLYEGEIRNRQANGKGIFYCTFPQYYSGTFENNLSNSTCKRVRICWGEITEGSSRQSRKIGVWTRLLTRGYNIEINTKSETGRVTFPYLNDDYYEGEVEINWKSEDKPYLFAFRKGTYYQKQSAGFKSVNITSRAESIYEIHEIRERGLRFEETFLRIYQTQSKIISQLKGYIMNGIKDYSIILTSLDKFLQKIYLQNFDSSTLNISMSNNILTNAFSHYGSLKRSSFQGKNPSPNSGADDFHQLNSTKVKQANLPLKIGPKYEFEQKFKSVASHRENSGSRNSDKSLIQDKSDEVVVESSFLKAGADKYKSNLNYNSNTRNFQSNAKNQEFQRGRVTHPKPPRIIIEQDQSSRRIGYNSRSASTSPIHPGKNFGTNQHIPDSYRKVSSRRSLSQNTVEPIPSSRSIKRKTEPKPQSSQKMLSNSFKASKNLSEFSSSKETVKDAMKVNDSNDTGLIESYAGPSNHANSNLVETVPNKISDSNRQAKENFSVKREAVVDKNYESVKVPLKQRQSYYIVSEDRDVDFFCGKIVKTKRQGFCRILLNNGIYKEGYFKNDCMEGEGRIIFPNSVILGGFFAKDILNHSAFIQINEAKYYGTFVNNEFIGNKVIGKPNGVIYTFDRHFQNLKTVADKASILFANSFTLVCMLRNGEIVENVESKLYDVFGSFWLGKVVIQRPDRRFLFVTDAPDNLVFHLMLEDKGIVVKV
jgi:hypothetical protein